MLVKKLDYKVPGGKLIRVRAEVENNLIHEIKITGDFFLHPEESIEEIENSLRGKNLEGDELDITLQQIIQKNSTTLLGISEKDFVAALMKLRD